jgi:hypothetical protein
MSYTTETSLASRGIVHGISGEGMQLHSTSEHDCHITGNVSTALES